MGAGGRDNAYKAQVDIVQVQQVKSLKVTKGVEKQNDG